MHYNVIVSISSIYLHNEYVEIFILQNGIVCCLKWISISQAWEGRAYDYCMDNLRKVGFPVDGLAFDPDLVTSINQFKDLKISTYMQFIT